MLFLAYVEVPDKNTYIGIMEGERATLTVELFDRVVKAEGLQSTAGVKVVLAELGRLVSLGRKPEGSSPIIQPAVNQSGFVPVKGLPGKPF